MKKILFFVSAGIMVLLVACSDKKETITTSGGMSDAAQKNLHASQVVQKAFESGDASGIDSVVAADFVDHTDRGDMGRDSLKAMIAMSKGQNVKVEVIKELADDEYVFSWLRFTGSSDGSMGMPAGPYDMKAIEAVKCKDGKAIEHWTFMEPRDMMKMMAQMGQHAPADHKPATDTAKPKM